MTEKLLPQLQLVLILVFCLVVLAGPAVIPSFQVLILAAALAGLLLGAVSAWVGWLAGVRGRVVVYPFGGWSLAILRLLFGRQSTRGLERGDLRPAGISRLAGLASLAAGALLGAASLAVAVFALFR